MMIDRLSAGWQLWLMNMTDDPDREAAGRRLSLARTGALAAIAIFAVAAGIFSGLAVFGPQRDGGGSPSLELERSAPSNGLSRFVRLAEPQDIPDLTFNDAEGKPRRLSEWRGKAVLLNLWATWCAPCKTEMPSLDRLQAKLGGDKFTVLALNTDRTGPKEPAAFYAKQGITHLGLYNDETAQANVTMRAEGLPLTVILNAEGREIARLLGPADWDSPEAAAKIEGLLRGKGG
jgi:thiol-disulfide isomerase/thioredoxin